ncbi:MAG: RraA family protein [Methylococcales bacterium]|nr:RraA family protein [Methylococcales bacterium]
MITVSQQTLDAIRPIGTSLVADAIETFSVRLANEGFIRSGALTDRTPGLAPLLGFAATARIRAVHPPIVGSVFAENKTWWRYLSALPEPRIVVFQDVDPFPGLGSFFGEMHVAVHHALGCAGIVTDGAVRDVHTFNKAGLHCFSGHVSVSRAYAHIIDFGVPVTIGGLLIKPGDLLYGDSNGVVSIPPEQATLIPAVAAEIRERKRRTIELCASEHFSLEKLEELTVSFGYELAKTGAHLDPKLKNQLKKPKK